MEHVELFSGIIVPFVNFVVFGILLVLFARKPLSAIFAKKREDYLLAVAEGQKVRQAAEDQNQRLKTQLAELSQTVATIKAEAQADAALEAKRIVDDAQRMAQALQQEAQRIAATEMEKARAELNNEIVILVHNEVEKLIGQQINHQNHLAIIKNRLPQIDRLS